MVDPKLQASLTNLGDTLAHRNTEAWRAFPQSDAVRELARQIKDETLAHLDQYIEEV
ncbi:MAG: hypothetical protein QM775_21550 [Pirellulales bacterium]